jgi:PEGA domain-containing protein
MRNNTLLVAMAVLVAATLGNAAEAGQRQRSPGHNGGGHAQGGGGQGQGGGGAHAQGGGGAQGGGSQSGPRYAAPREDRGGGGDRGGERVSRGDRGGERVSQSDRGSERASQGDRRSERGARESGGTRQEAAPPQETRSAPEQGSRRAQRRPDSRVEARTDTRVQSAPQTTVDPRSRSTATRRSDGRTYSGRTNDTRAYTNGNNNGNWNGRDTGRIAVPRQGPGPQRRDGRYAYGGGTYSSGGRYYSYAPRYYYSPRYYTYRPYYFYRPTIFTAFSFGYGLRGRGYFYYDTFYDSYVFYPRTIVRYGDSGRYGYPTGSLRLDIEPRDAQVYIDGAYAGLVDDFDGVFQSLRLEAGDYHVEVVLPGFESLEFDVRILPGEKTTYRGDLLEERP